MTDTAIKLRNEIRTSTNERDLNQRHREVQAWISSRLDELRRVRAIDEEWTREIQDHPENFDANTARDLHAFYEDWYSQCDEVDARVSRLTDGGRAVLGMLEHNIAREDVRTILDSMPIDDLVEAMTG